MDKKPLLLFAALFVGVLLAGVVAARPGALGSLNPTSAVAGSARSLLGGEREDDDDDEHDHDEHEDDEHDDEQDGDD